MRKTLKLKDGEAQIGQTVWYVNAEFGKDSALRNIVLNENNIKHQDWSECVDDSTPCFCTKTALFAYCEENNIECIELERDVYKERLESKGKPKTDIERFVSICEDFGIEVIQTQMKKDRDVIGSFISISDNETETRFVFLKDGKFESFYSLLED